MTNVVKSSVTGRIIRSDKTTKTVNSKIISYGGDLDTSRFRWHLTPTPATDGAQTIFTIPGGEQYTSGLLEVFLDGLIQTKNVDYTETTSKTFTMTTAPSAVETLRVNYIKAA